jgi:4-hydroxybenzoate polyprenyltransferase
MTIGNDWLIARSMTSPLPDSEAARLTPHLSARLRDYVELARFDRPIGAWLLFWPGAWAVALAGQAVARWDLLLLLALGAVAMRGAGCVYNDLADRKLDAQVARTAARPLASGRISPSAAWAYLVALSLIGLIVLLQLAWLAQLVALASLPLVAAYPFMKRISWWPQAWLGLVFSWAALVGMVEVTGGLSVAGLLLYAGSILWVIGYDTIYACQDLEDDALAGIKSSARALGRWLRLGVILCYAGALLAWAWALWLVRPDGLALLSLLPASLQLGWQVATLNPADSHNALLRFRSNRLTGLLIFAAMLVVGQTA